MLNKFLAIILSLSIFLTGCASTTANPVPIAQVGDETKTCDAIANEMQKMVTAKIQAEGDKNTQIGTNAALAITGIFLIVPCCSGGLTVIGVFLFFSIVNQLTDKKEMKQQMKDDKRVMNQQRKDDKNGTV